MKSPVDNFLTMSEIRKIAKKSQKSNVFTEISRKWAENYQISRKIPGIEYLDVILSVEKGISKN